MSLKKKFLKSRPACKVTFQLPKKATNGAKEVLIVGDFNNWDRDNGHPMKMRNGDFQGTIELESNREYQFRYLMDGAVWENDWEADKYAESPFGVENSVVVTIEQWPLEETQEEFYQ